MITESARARALAAWQAQEARAARAVMEAPVTA
jgi:hypothetical protein